MPLLPEDQLWSPLFADARWEDEDGRRVENALLGSHTSPYLRVCWDRAITVRAPLAVPPPWTGTVTMSAPAGCADAELGAEEHGLPLLAIAAPGFVLAGEIRLGKKVIHTETVTVEAQDPADARNGTFWYGEHELVRFAPGGAGINGSIFLMGDALPWLQVSGDNPYDRGLYYTFLASTEIPAEELIRRTAATPYAPVAVLTSSGSGTGAGGDPVRRANLQEALAAVEIERLAPDDRLELQWRRRSLAGWPLTAPPAGRATLVVDPTTIAVEVAGALLLNRDMEAQGAALHAKTAKETTLTVDVPAGEAVLVRTTNISFAAGGGFWHGTGHQGWSVLLPGHRYEIKNGEVQRTAPPGTTCIGVEGAPGTVKVFGTEASADRRVGGVPGWPRPATVHPTEPGRYRVVFDVIGVTRVHYEPGGCGGAPEAGG